MTQFKVRRYENAIWDKQEPLLVEAASAKRAAEKVCGEALISAGTHGKLRAEVWPASSPEKKETLYSI